MMWSIATLNIECASFVSIMKKILDGPLLWAQKMVFDTILGVPISALNEAPKTYSVL